MEKSREEELNDLKRKYTEESESIVKELIKAVFFVNVLGIALINRTIEHIKKGEENERN